jgi:hypothetical protein
MVKPSSNVITTGTVVGWCRGAATATVPVRVKAVAAKAATIET